MSYREKLFNLTICDFCSKGAEPWNDGFSTCVVCGAKCHDFQDGGGYCMEQHKKTHKPEDFIPKNILSHDDMRNIGHGHVRPRPDGVKARCGGPGLCDECSKEYASGHPMLNMEVGSFTPFNMQPGERILEIPLSYEIAWQRLIKIVNTTDVHSISLDKLKSIMLECLINEVPTVR